MARLRDDTDLSAIQRTLLAPCCRSASNRTEVQN